MITLMLMTAAVRLEQHFNVVSIRVVVLGLGLGLEAQVPVNSTGEYSDSLNPLEVGTATVSCG